MTVVLVLAALHSICASGQDLRGSTPESDSNAIAANGRYHALVIGIDDYPEPLHKLKTAVNDANAIGKLLRDRYGFQVQYLLDHDATRFKILRGLKQFRGSLKEDDSLLIYFGGHGYFDHGTDKAYWLPVDADSGESPNTIMADDLTSIIRALLSRHVLIVSDSCYSGGLSRDADEPVRTGSDPALIARELRSRSRTLMASGGLESVADSGENGHSVFANAILRALEQTQDRMFTAVDLFYSSIRRQVAGKSSQLPEYSTIRNSKDEDGDFVFIRRDEMGGRTTTLPTTHSVAPSEAQADLPAHTSIPRADRMPSSRAAAEQQSSAQPETWMLQVAAVSQSEDADVLVSALRKRGYPVSAHRDPADALIRVQIGPFSTRDDAEAESGKLANDGYTALVQQVQHQSSARADAWMVQIAALRKSEDVDVLVRALRKHGYNVSVKRDPADGRFHLRIGPFATLNDAAVMRAKLLNDGYNAIVQP